MLTIFSSLAVFMQSVAQPCPADAHRALRGPALPEGSPWHSWSSCSGGTHPLLTQSDLGLCLAQPDRAASRGSCCPNTNPSSSWAPRAARPCAHGKLGTAPGLFHLILNPFIEGMWFALYGRKMPQTQPRCGCCSHGQMGSHPTAWTECAAAPASSPCSDNHDLGRDHPKKILLCLKTTMGTAQSGAQGLCFYRNLHPKCAKPADKPKKAEEDRGAGAGLGSLCPSLWPPGCASLVVLMFVSTGLDLSAGEKEQPLL